MDSINVKIAKQLVKLAKSLVASGTDDAEDAMIKEFLSFLKRDFEYSDSNVTITFMDTSDGSLYGDYSINVDGDCSGIEAFVNNPNSSFGDYFKNEVARNLQEEMNSSLFIDYENALMDYEGMTEEEADELATEKLTTFMTDSNWGNVGPNSGKIYCNGSEVGKFDFFGLLAKCCVSW